MWTSCPQNSRCSIKNIYFAQFSKKKDNLRMIIFFMKVAISFIFRPLTINSSFFFTRTLPPALPFKIKPFERSSIASEQLLYRNPKTPQIKRNRVQISLLGNSNTSPHLPYPFLYSIINNKKKKAALGSQ